MSLKRPYHIGPVLLLFACFFLASCAEEKREKPVVAAPAQRPAVKPAPALTNNLPAKRARAEAAIDEAEDLIARELARRTF